MTGDSVLVTDGEQRATLAVVRSLGRSGRTVHVASTGGRSLAGASRYAAGDHAVGSPGAAPDRFVDAVAALAVRHGVRWVVPITDAAMLALTRRPEQLSPASVPFPPYEVVTAVGDKRAVLERAERLGLRVPDQVVLADAAAPIGSLPFPLVGKPSRSVAPEGGGVRGGAFHAANAAELRAHLAGLDHDAWPVLLQRRVVGPGIGVFLLRWDGRTVAAFSHRRLREKPPSGGVSVYRESIAAPPDLLGASEALLQSFGWNGPAMVEYKVDAATGEPYLMEINGRYWGSLQLAIDAGVDFPRLHLEVAEGAVPAPVTTWAVGVRSRWELGDVDHLLAMLTRSRRALALPPEAPGRLAAVFSVLRPWWPGERWEVLRPGDPRPFLREVAGWIREVAA